MIGKLAKDLRGKMVYAFNVESISMDLREAQMSSQGQCDRPARSERL
jgi:hypothetical protein